MPPLPSISPWKRYLKPVIYIKIKNPPKNHILLFFAGALAIPLPIEGQNLLEELEGMGVEAKYPPDLDQTLKELSNQRVQEILAKAKQVFLWIKTELDY